MSEAFTFSDPQEKAPFTFSDAPAPPPPAQPPPGDPDVPIPTPDGGVTFAPSGDHFVYPLQPEQNHYDYGLNIASNLGHTAALGLVAAGTGLSNVGASITQEQGHQLAAMGHVLDSTWLGQQMVDVGTKIEGGARDEIAANNAAIEGQTFNPVDRIVAMAGTSFGMGIPALASHSPAAATMLMGYMTGQQSRNEALDAGKSELASIAHATFQGAVESLTEMIPMGKLFKDTGPIKKWLETMLYELPGEELATVLQSAEDQYTMHPEKTFEDWTNELPKMLAETAAVVPLVTTGNVAAVSLSQKAAQVKATYDELIKQEQLKKVKGEVTSEGQVAIQVKLKQLMDEVGTEADQKAADTITTFHGSPSGQIESFDDSQVGTRSTGPEVPGSDLPNTRAAGHFTSESKSFASMFTRGPGSQEQLTEVPEQSTSTVDAEPLPALMNIRDFLAKNAPEQQTPLPEPPEAQQTSVRTQGMKRALAPIYETWGAWQNGDLGIHILDHAGQLPDEILSRVDNKKMDLTNTAAIYDGANNIYMFANNIENRQEAETYLIHETFGHFGMEQVVPDWENFASTLVNTAPKIMPDAWAYVMEHYAKTPGFSQVTAAKETLAVWTQMHPNESNSFLDNIWTSLRAWARNMGFQLDITRNDVVALLQKSREGIEKGTLRGPRPGEYLASRSQWDPTVRRWGEALFGHSDFPLLEDASPNYAQREPIETGKPFMARVYHGSPFGDRSEFSGRALGAFTGAESAKMATFFGGTGKTAGAYAERVDADFYTGYEELVREDRQALLPTIVAASPYAESEGKVFDMVNKEFVSEPSWVLAQGNAQQRIRKLSIKWYNGLSTKEQVLMAKKALGRDPQYIAPVTIPAYIAMKNPLVVENMGDYKERPWVEALRAGYAGGHDGVVWLGASDPYFDNYFAVLKGNETQIRSVHAKFDTSKMGSPKLLAARGKVNIARINAATYLDLEKPLLEQKPSVQEALRKAGIVPSSLTGQEFYDAITKKEGGKRQASDWLDSHGIPGATYREAFRPKGQKEQLVRNFITFKGSNAAILSAEAQQILVEEKARQQSLQAQEIDRRMKEPPEINAKKRLELLGKAIKMPRDTLAKMRQEAIVWNKFLEFATGIEEINFVNNPDPNAPKVPSLQIYTDNVRALWGLKGTISTAANEQVRRWRKHIAPGQQSEHFDTLMEEASITSEGLGRALDPLELNDLAQKHKLTTLKENELKFAQDVWEDYRNVFKRMEEAVHIDIDKKIQNQQDAAARHKEVKDRFAKVINSNFFPKSNFGEHPVEVRARKDGTKYRGREYKADEVVHYSTYSSVDDALNAAKKLEENEFPKKDFHIREHQILSNRSQEFMGIPPSFYKELIEVASDTFESSADLATLEAQLELMQQENSATSRTMRRVLKESNAYGYDTNSQRIYANFMQRFANQIAKMRHGPNMQAAIDSLGPVEGNNSKRDQIRQYMRDHRKYIINPGNELTWLRSFGFNFYIGAVVKSAVVNLTQVPMVSLPHLSKQHGMISATKALAQNMDAYFAKAQGKLVKFPPKKQAMFNELYNRGMLNESFANELAAVAEGSTFEDLSGLHTSTARAIDRGMHFITDKFAFLFHHAEGINRYITAGAAYDLAISKGVSHEKAINDAMRAVQMTQGEYARYNRPKAAWGKKSAAFLFMRFTTHMLWYVGYQPAKWRVLSAWLLFGGLMGLPFAENIIDLIDALGTQWHKRIGSKEPLVQAKQTILRFLENERSQMGQYQDFMPAPDLIMHGLSRAVPLPFSDQSVDVSQSIGLGRPIPGTAEFMKGDLGTAVLKNLGAVAEIPISLYGAVTSDDADQWKRWESVLPMSLRNMSAATRWVVRGNETNASGQPIQEFDLSSDPAPVVAKALGFPITGVNRTREADYVARSSIQFYSDWKGQILSRAHAAYARGNENDQRIVRDEVLAYNKRVPYPEMGISGQALSQSILGTARSDALHAMGFPSQAKPYARVYRDVQEVQERSH